MTEMSLSIFFFMVVVTITAARSTGDERKEVTLSIQAKASEEGVEGTLELTGGTNSDSENDTAEGGSSKDDQKLEDKHLSEEMGEFRREWKQSNRDLVDQLQTLQANSCNASNESHGEYREAGANSTSNASCNSGDISQLEARILKALISKIETDISTSSMTGSTNLTRGGPNAWGTACEQRERSESKSFSKICFENNVQNHTQGSDTIVCGTKWKAQLQCGLGIGINSAGIFPFGNLFHSSSYSGYLSANGRLSGDYGWCPSKRPNEYVGVKLPKGVAQPIHGVILQGIGNGEGISANFNESFVKTYKVTYMNSEEEWLPVTDESGAVMIFEGNVDDKDTPITQKFPQPVAAKQIKNLC